MTRRLRPSFLFSTSSYLTKLLKIKAMNNLIELLGEESYVEFVLELLEEKDKCYRGEGKCYEDIEEDMLVFGEI